MLSLLRKNYLALLLGVLSFSTIHAYDCCEPCDHNRLYIGGFGGGLYSNSSRATQLGTAFFTEAEGGPLAVVAEGRTRSTSSGFGGVQLGYEWNRNDCCSDWGLAFAGEAEVFFYGHNKKGHLFNQTDIDRLPEHDFYDSFKLRTGVGLVNAVISLNSSCLGNFTPYIGGGIGAARLSIHHANSLQVDPIEEGINHFNSRTHDSSWAFAAQAKAGIRYNFCESFHVFAEYRYLFIDASNYIFGSTEYPNHAVTSPWNVKLNNITYNAFAVGIQFDL